MTVLYRLLPGWWWTDPFWFPGVGRYFTIFLRSPCWLVDLRSRRAKTLRIKVYDKKKKNKPVHTAVVTGKRRKTTTTTTTTTTSTSRWAWWYETNRLTWNKHKIDISFLKKKKRNENNIYRELRVFNTVFHGDYPSWIKCTKITTLTRTREHLLVVMSFFKGLDYYSVRRPYSL